MRCLRRGLRRSLSQSPGVRAARGDDMRYPWRSVWLAATGWILLARAVAALGAEGPSPGDRIPTAKGDLWIHPVSHATLVLRWDGKAIYVDPVGGSKAFAGFPRPDLVLVTHFHGDHLDAATLASLVGPQGGVPIVGPPSVIDRLQGPLRDAGRAIVAGQKAEVAGIPIEAVPAYNLTPQRQRFHPKGRDVGYVLALSDKRVYIAGDTEDTPEMRGLGNIDVAFLPMNLPYTMSVAQAAGAVRQFRPKIVYPYHFRNADGTLADLDEFRRQVGDEAGVEVRVRQWYPAAGR